MTREEQFGTWDFGLTPDQEQRAARLQRESIIVDALYQGPYGYRAFTPEVEKWLAQDPANADMMHAWGSSLSEFRRRAIAGEFDDYATCWQQSGITAASWEFQADSAASLAYGCSSTSLLLDNMPWLTKALTAADIRAAKAAGNQTLYLEYQPSNPISRDLGLLRAGIDFGLRQVMLTYNNQDHVGAGCTERTNAGLSHFGIRVVQLLNDQRVIVDTAHCGKQTTLDACRVSEFPVVASHTAAESVYLHARGKSDEEIEAIAATGGVIAVCVVPFFLGKQGATLDTWLDHIDHIVSLVGWQHAGIGTDWPLTISKEMGSALFDAVVESGWTAEHNIKGAENLLGFDDYRDFPNFARGLVSRGYTDEQVEGILGGNYLRVFEQVCG